MNTKKDRTKPSDEWETPQALWDALNSQYQFTKDLAASESNHKCDYYFTKEDSLFNTGYLPKYKDDVLWCNPPFSKAADFFKHIASCPGRTVAIYKSNNMETAAWKVILKEASWFLIFHKRIQYELGGRPGQGCKFGSALIGFNGVAVPNKSILLMGTVFTSWHRAL